MSRRGTILILRAVVFATLGIVAFLLAWQAAAPRLVTVAAPARGQAVQAVYATGTVEANVTVRVAGQTAGRIIELKADEGQIVKTGDILARFDDGDMRASAAELEARALYAGQTFERVEALSRQGWVTRDRADQARADMEATRQAAQRAKDQMSFLTIRAPTAGQIIRRDGEVGDFIPLNQPVFYLARAGGALRITADVDEEDVPLVAIGQKVLIRADAFPDQVFDGGVAEITPKGDPVARSYRVRIALPENIPLRIGMTAETNIVTRENKDALLISTSALPSGGTALGQGKSADSMVWVVRDGRVRRQPVRIGIRGRERTEIANGVTESDHLVVDAPQNLEPDERVIVKLAAQPSTSASNTPKAGAAQ
ncbi:MAG: efflux RND transporter periplasmic adaptor subunit [Roseiarcus sp.]|jgi:RND family efflux transporter MFP subunit